MENIIKHQKQGLDMLSKAMGLPTVEEMLVTKPIKKPEPDECISCGRETYHSTIVATSPDGDREPMCVLCNDYGYTSIPLTNDELRETDPKLIGHNQAQEDWQEYQRII